MKEIGEPIYKKDKNLLIEKIRYDVNSNCFYAVLILFLMLYLTLMLKFLMPLNHAYLTLFRRK